MTNILTKDKTDIKALVVDDELIARTANKMILEAFRCTVTLANDGLEALNLIKNNIFNVILLDINLPKLSGIELTKIIRSSEKIKKVLIIGITAQKDEKIEAEAKEAGMNAIIVKPVSQNFIKNLIGEILSKKLN